MDNKTIFIISVVSLLLLSSAAFASVSTVSTSMSTSRATTGTSVTGTVTVTATGTESGSVQLSCTPSGVSISDPSSGQYQGVSLSTSPTSKTFTFTGGTANTYTCSGQSGGVSGDATIVFVDPTSLSVTGTPSSKSVSASGETFSLTVNIQNSQSSAITTSYSLSLPSGYSASGDSTSSTITVGASSTTALTWTVTTGSSSGSVTLSVGDNSNAFSSSVTVPAAATTTTTTTAATTTSSATITTTPAGVKIATAKGNVVITIPSIAAGNSSLIPITATEDVAFTEVKIFVANKVNNIQITIAKLDSKPASITQEVSGKVYHYIQIDKNNTSVDAAVNKTNIKFKVAKSWLTTNNVDGATVALYRYSDNQWNKLNTTKTGEDTDNLLYETTSPGLSVFAISGELKAAVPTPTNVTTSENQTGIPSGLLPNANNYVIFLVIGVAAVGVIVYFVVKNKKGPIPSRKSWTDLKRKYSK